jgi:hypothetical protein
MLSLHNLSGSNNTKIKNNLQISNPDSNNTSTLKLKFGWLPASQQCFSLISFQHQPPTTSSIFLSQQISTSQPNEANISTIFLGHDQ